MKPEFKEGQLWRSNNPDHRGWCKHGLMKIINYNGFLRAVDTYWGSYDDTARLHQPEVITANLEFVINVNECRKTHAAEFFRYAESDRAYIPIGGGSEQYLVRISATPDPILVKQQLVEKAERLREEIRWNTKELAETEEKLKSMSGGIE